VDSAYQPAKDAWERLWHGISLIATPDDMDEELK
jgi:hypothetical protein